jgi:hypothetical protein
VHEQINDTVTGAFGSFETHLKDVSFKKREIVQIKGTSLVYDANNLSFGLLEGKYL